MEMTVKDERKLVEIWLTNAEKSDPVLRAGLQGIYDTYKKKKYLVAVFESGNCDLYAQTRDLLLYNRQRLAEQEIRREKAQQMTMNRRNHWERRENFFSPPFSFLYDVLSFFRTQKAPRQEWNGALESTDA